MAKSIEAPKTAMQKVLDVVERVGNKVPHPVVIFLVLIAIVVVLSHVLYLAGASATTQVVEYQPQQIAIEGTTLEDEYVSSWGLVDSKHHEIKTETVAVRSLLTSDGIRFIYTSIIPNFMGFAAVGLIIVAMVGVGVAEESGLIKTLIRKLVAVAPRWAIAYILVLVGILSSIAADAGYLVLIPLAGAAFLSVGRNPLAGLAAGFAAVAGAFTVNAVIKPLDAILTEFTNDAIHLVDPNRSITLTANLWFSIVSVAILTVVITFITQRIIEPRLGKYTGTPSTDKPAKDGDKDAGKSAAKGGKTEPESEAITAEESRGLVWAALGLVGVLAFFGVLTLWSGAPLRNPETGALIGDSPFMNGLIAVIMVLFLVTGVAFGVGAGTLKGTGAIIKAIEKAVAGLGSLIFLLLILSQFIAYFNYSNIGTIMAVRMADVLQGASIPPLALLLGFIVVVAILDLLITGAIAKWALFAPIFVPLLMKLGVAPEAVLAAYRVADSPINMITPLNAYFALVVVFAQKYDKNAGVGTIVALMLPYVAGIFVAWTALFVAWQVLGLPWGIG
ncbi:MAG: AbgT family transporter [Phycisphaerales bacterium]